VTPETMPIEGGVITINGTGFGPQQCTDAALLSKVLLHVSAVPAPGTASTFDPRSGAWSLDPPLATLEVECAVQAWAQELILCRAPPGLDASAPLRVVVGNQSVVPSTRLRFAAPTVASVACNCSVGTSGGDVVTVVGTGFPLPPWPVAVLVGGTPCSIVDSSRTTTASLACQTPPGVGTVEVSVNTPLQTASVVATLAYGPPSIVRVSTPLGRPIGGSFPVEVDGEVSTHAVAMGL
jgi:hypothetical protein